MLSKHIINKLCYDTYLLLSIETDCFAVVILKLKVSYMCFSFT